MLIFIAVARGLHIAADFCVFGTCFVEALLLPDAAPPRLRQRVIWLAWGSLAVLLVAGLAWFVLEAADMAGAQDAADVWAALPVVAGSTRFGALLMGRAAAAVAAVALLQLGWARPAAMMGGGSVVAEAWLDHGGAMTGPVGDVLLVSAVIHLASGGAWLGALPGLRLALKHLPIREAARVARNFSPIGMACVIGLAGTAGVQYFFLIGRPAALFDSAYGLVAAGKIALLLALLAFAAANRTRLTPALEAGDETARPRLLRSVGAEVALGLLAVLAAGLLLQLTPPTMAMGLNGS